MVNGQLLQKINYLQTNKVIKYMDSQLRLTLIPPNKVTDKIELSISAAICNNSQENKKFKVLFFLDSCSGRLLHEQSIMVPPNTVNKVRFKHHTSDMVGEHRVVVAIESNGEIIDSASRPIEVIKSDTRSLKQISGAWAGLYHWCEKEGQRWNEDIKKMTNKQWQELIQAMHDCGMKTVVIQDVFNNDVYRYDNNIATEGYAGRAYYPSKLYPGRMPITAKDPIEAILSKADELEMSVFLGVGLYIWHYYPPESLEWHKNVADELWERYGHHSSLYGWYISEEGPGDLACCAKETDDIKLQSQNIINFYRGFRKHVNKYAPDKPVMAAFNTWGIYKAVDVYKQLLPHIDILASFCFDRMKSTDLTGPEAEQLLRNLSKEADTHFWLDLELFSFGKNGELYPPDIRKVDMILEKYSNFETILCYQFPGLMNAPWMSRKPGGEATVKMYQDYQKYLAGGLDAIKIDHAALDKPVKLRNTYNPRYSGKVAAVEFNGSRDKDIGGGLASLTNGWQGGYNFTDGWQGYDKCDFEAVVDLEEEITIEQISANFMQLKTENIFLPDKVEFAISNDNKIFKTVASICPDIELKNMTQVIKSFVATTTPHQGRYVRIIAHNATKNKNWQFIDSIMVNPVK